MASTNKTENVKLSQFIATDKPGWLTDYNNDMQKIEDSIKKIKDALYPVGAYYFSSNSTDPATLFGFSTWKRVNGRMLMGVDEADANLNEAGKTGGNATVTLSDANMPKHFHLDVMVDLAKVRWAGSMGGMDLNLAATYGINGSTGSATKTGYAGNSQAFSILSPYETAYIWKRTA